MSAGIEEYRSRLREALTTINQLKVKLESLTRSQAEPIAIIGIACRFPGGSDNPERFFSALNGGLDAVTEVPETRWRLGPVTNDPLARAIRWGAFLEGVDLFDAGFFGITPREAARLDPQQRLLLELSWEALENAGVVPGRLVGSKTGVFLGMMTNDYALVDANAGREQQDAYSTTGNMHCFPAGRLSYTLGLQGPSMVVDTACSSSLVALHLACQSLRHQESELAVVGGVNLMLAEETTEQFSKTRALSPDGRCKTFDATANGYVRGEGCGIIVLKRLSDAQRDKNPIVALIRGTAVNQDGRSTGLTTPNVLAQEALIRSALSNAGVSAEEIGYIEAHGTGTPLGDPIEIDALRATVGAPRANKTTCVIGAVKTNIGHLEAGAGMAGIIKTAMIFRHSLIPKNNNFKNLNPRIELNNSALALATRPIPWPRTDKPRRAGASSFGMSGTNAHVILEEAPASAPKKQAAEHVAYLLPITAKTPEAMVDYAKSYSVWLSEQADDALHDIVHTACLYRTHHEYRLTAVARTREEFSRILACHARGDHASGIATGRVRSSSSPKIVFIFPGQGSQWVGMGQELLAKESVFRSTMEACDIVIRREAGFSVLEQLLANAEKSRLTEIDVVQPVLFAMEIALAALWQSWGVTPDCVIGHSMGEVAAAHVAGILSLEDACRIICQRSRLMRSLSGRGAMALVELPISAAQSAIEGQESALSIAVSNGPRSTVISGDPSALESVLAKLQTTGVFYRRINVDVASHSPQVEPIRRDLLKALQGVAGVAGRLPMRSTVTGNLVDGRSLDATYWVENLRQPVRFSQVTQSLIADGFVFFVEISPHPILLPSIAENFESMAHDGIAVESMHRNRSEVRTFLESIASLHVNGCAIDFRKRYAELGEIVPLPPYPWQRERHWIEMQAQPQRAVTSPGKHPFLGKPFIPGIQPELHLWEQAIGLQSLPYLTGHRVRNEVVFPGAGFIEMATAAANEVYGEGAFRFDEMTFERMLALQHDAQSVQISLLEEGGGRASITISSRHDDAGAWQRNAAARVSTINTSTPPDPVDRQHMEACCSEVIESRAHYEFMSARGLHYDGPFRSVSKLRLGSKEIVADLRLPDTQDLSDSLYHVHPGLIDGCFQAAVWTLPRPICAGSFLPLRASGIRIHQRRRGELRIHARLLEEPTKNEFSVALVAYDLTGNRILEVAKLSVRIINEQDALQEQAFDDCIFELAWRKADQPPTNQSTVGSGRQWLVFHDSQNIGKCLADGLRSRGHRVVEVWPGTKYSTITTDRHTIDPSRQDHWGDILAGSFGMNGCDGIVYCGILDCTDLTETTEQSLENDLRNRIFGVLRLAQALAKQIWRNAPRFHVLTRGSQAVTSTDSISVMQSTVWGLGRVLTMEQPDTGCIRIDLPAKQNPEEIAWVLGELETVDDEDQIAFRSDGRYVARLARGSWAREESAANLTEIAGDTPFRLETREPGILERLALYPINRLQPGPGEVEIAVEVAGLNFLDVMKAMGIYPGMDRNSVPLGHECAGRVVAVGAGVTRFQIGQPVIASALRSMSTHVTVRQEFVVPKPDNLTFEQAATIPAVYMTVHWALRHVARLQPGDRILIHSASGGTGLAAIQYARLIGAEIFATAGNEDKRAFLRSLGIEHVFDSRTPKFADEIAGVTGGRGVDVVLNSLTGDALVRSFDVLAPYGRFLEIGKKDIYENTRLGLLPFRKALSYTAVDLAGMADVNPRQYGALLEEVISEFADGTMTPGPITTFPASQADAAFRLMAQAKHVGKIAIRMCDPTARIVRERHHGAKIHGDATYLITGGLGGLGLVLAEGLAKAGAKSLVLVGRNDPNASTAKVLRNIEAAGAKAIVMRMDVSVLDEVKATIAKIERELPPLRGIVHAAGVLDDKTIAQMGETEFFRPLAPKVRGGFNLHEATRHLNLDFFVMYSSAAGLLGSPGQANYAAGNTFLDALCHARVREGLPATSIQWGAFANVGLAAAEDVRGKRLAARGSASFQPDDETPLFLRVISSPRTNVSLMHFDVRQWVEFYPQIAGSPFLSDLVNEKPLSEEGRETATFRDSVERAQPQRRPELMESHILEQLGKVLRLDPKRLDKQSPFASLGMDSLMSLELRNRLEASLGLKLSAALLFTYATTSALAIHLVEKLFNASAQDASQDAPAPATLRTPTVQAPERAPLQATQPAVQSKPAGSDLMDRLEALEEYLK